MMTRLLFHRRTCGLLLLSMCLLQIGTARGFVVAFGRAAIPHPSKGQTIPSSPSSSSSTSTSSAASCLFLSSKDSSPVPVPVPVPTTTTSSPIPAASKLSLRRIARVEKFARLPVWPVWAGVIIFVVSRTLGDEWAAKLEDAIGGRVCPNFFNADMTGTTTATTTTSPFIMLVHHRHSFAVWDPIRWFQNQFILPEGFPAHPHRGFTTLTYFLKGGFRHRDSLGIVQDYGRRQGQQQQQQHHHHQQQQQQQRTTDEYPHSQWLFTGAGILHEEMFDSNPQQELYQLWVNVPSERKLDPPSVQLLGDSQCPTVVVKTTDNDADSSPSMTSETVVLAGEYQGRRASTPILSDLAVFHVRVNAGSSWSYEVPSTFETLVLYIRKGSCVIDGEKIPVHHTAYLEPLGRHLVVSTLDGDGVDFLLLTGAPLREPVAAQGSMVMNTGNQINEAYRDYQLGMMGTPWDHKLSNEEWLEHVANHPCRYQYSEKISGQK